MKFLRTLHTREQVPFLKPFLLVFPLDGKQTVSKLHDVETKVFISHRLANCQIADTIYFLKGSKIIETGSHDELMTKKGAYYELFSKQSKIYVENDINILETHIT